MKDTPEIRSIQFLQLYDSLMPKEPLINSAAHLAVPFPPCKLANFLTYLQ